MEIVMSLGPVILSELGLRLDEVNQGASNLDTVLSKSVSDLTLKVIEINNISKGAINTLGTGVTEDIVNLVSTLSQSYTEVGLDITSAKDKSTSISNMMNSMIALLDDLNDSSGDYPVWVNSLISKVDTLTSTLSATDVLINALDSNTDTSISKSITTESNSQSIVDKSTSALSKVNSNGAELDTIDTQLDNITTTIGQLDTLISSLATKADDILSDISNMDTLAASVLTQSQGIGTDIGDCTTESNAIDVKATEIETLVADLNHALTNIAVHCDENKSSSKILDGQFGEVVETIRSVTGNIAIVKAHATEFINDAKAIPATANIITQNRCTWLKSGNVIFWDGNGDKPYPNANRIISEDPFYPSIDIHISTVYVAACGYNGTLFGYHRMHDTFEIRTYSLITGEVLTTAVIPNAPINDEGNTIDMHDHRPVVFINNGVFELSFNGFIHTVDVNTGILTHVDNKAISGDPIDIVAHPDGILIKIAQGDGYGLYDNDLDTRILFPDGSMDGRLPDRSELVKFGDIYVGVDNVQYDLNLNPRPNTEQIWEVGDSQLIPPYGDDRVLYRPASDLLSVRALRFGVGSPVAVTNDGYPMYIRVD